jgi:hypothetical protein
MTRGRRRPPPLLRLARVAALAGLGAATGCGDSPPNLSRCASPPVAGPESWPEADELFRRDPKWLGGDGAYSVGLPDGRVLWFFDDSFVSTGGPRDRRHATFVHNSVGVQSTTDPTRASLQLFWRTHPDGAPGSFFPDPAGGFYGVGVPVIVGGRLLVFLWREHLGTGAFPVVVGWNAALVTNPEAPPDTWDVQMLEPPQWRGPNGSVSSVGGAGVLVDGGYLYAHVTDSLSLDATLARYRLDAAAAGDLSAPEWWCGAAGWVAAAADPRPEVVLPNAGTEFSVERAPRGGFLMASVVGSVLDAPRQRLALRSAPSIAGPWSDAAPVYHPPEADQPGVFIYAGKSHPELADGTLVLTYGANGWDLSTAIDDMCLYFPRFARVAAP